MVCFDCVLRELYRLISTSCFLNYVIFILLVTFSSSTRLNIYSSNLHETPVRTEKLYTIDPDQVENLLDEPLLPKVCLRLVWSETPSARSHSTLTNTGFFSPLNNESSYKKENVSNFVPRK